MAKGIIYVMKCISLPGLIKIGKTETKQFESRMRGLEKDGYRHEMLQREFAIEVENFDEKEKMLHKIYSTSRVGDSELFATDCKAAVELLKAFEGRQVYPDLNNHKNASKPQVAKSSSSSTKKTGRASRLLLKDIGIPKGAVLTYVSDPTITCTVVDTTDNKVSYKGKIYTISGLVKYLKNDGLPYQGSNYLMYKGKKLTQIRKEKGV